MPCLLALPVWVGQDFKIEKAILKHVITVFVNKMFGICGVHKEKKGA